MILSLALIVSAWLFTRSQESSLTAENSSESADAIEVRPYIEQKTNNDWKKLLTRIDPKDQVVTNLAKTDPKKFDDTTLTAQLARDFFSQYILAKQGGVEISQDNANQIVQSISTSEKYTSLTSPIYRVGNLKVTSKSDVETMRRYKSTINTILNKRSVELKDDPVTIIQEAINTQSEKTMQKIDPIIITAKSFIDDLLNTEVPQVAVNLHLALLNSTSNLLTDLQAIRVLLNDPTIALIALGQYNSHLTSFRSAYNNMNSFLVRY